MAGACLADTQTIELSYDAAENLIADARVAGGRDAAQQVWPYDAPSQQANGLRIDPTLGSFGGLWVAPPGAVQVEANVSLFPEQTETSLADGTHYLDDGNPDLWEIANPSTVLPAVALVWVGCSMHYNNADVDDPSDEHTLCVLQTSHTNGWSGSFVERDHCHFYGSFAATFPAMSDIFTLTFPPGGVRSIAARVRADVAEGCDILTRSAIRLRAMIVAAPNL